MLLDMQIIDNRTDRQEPWVFDSQVPLLHQVAGTGISLWMAWVLFDLVLLAQNGRYPTNAQARIEGTVLHAHLALNFQPSLFSATQNMCRLAHYPEGEPAGTGYLCRIKPIDALRSFSEVWPSAAKLAARGDA
jgi:hypothetical protein